jgi:hypothetical protein
MLFKIKNTFKKYIKTKIKASPNTKILNFSPNTKILNFRTK